jgi:predicted transposase/invertase (TIGR01784 family)
MQRLVDKENAVAGPKINNPHDKFFRAAMEHKPVAADFFNHHLPSKVRQALNVESLKLIQQSYVDNGMQESISDLVFSCELADKPAYLALLVEHQSSPDPMLPFRIHGYLFGILQSYRKQRPNGLLPAVYTLVFYHGEATPYPYSLDLLDVFDDPLGLMREVLYQPLSLIDVNQLTDEELMKQQWVGPMARALKHIRERDLAPFALDILGTLTWSMTEAEAVELLQLLLNYLLKVGNIEDVKTFVEVSTERLSGPVRSEIMTFADKLKDEGMQQGIQEGRREGIQAGSQERAEKIALTMLQEGVEAAFVAKVTGLSLSHVERLSLTLKN